MRARHSGFARARQPGAAFPLCFSRLALKLGENGGDLSMAFTNPDGAGVGGWLALFVLIMAVFTPIGVLISTYGSLYGDPAVAAAYRDSWGAIQLFEWGLALAVIACCWFIAWRLNYVQVWRSVRIAIFGIWVIGLGALVVDFAGIALLAGIPFAQLAGAAGPEFVRSLVFCAIWTTYFLVSKRVANTYPRHADPDEAAAVFQ